MNVSKSFRLYILLAVFSMSMTIVFFIKDPIESDAKSDVQMREGCSQLCRCGFYLPLPSLYMMRNV